MATFETDLKINRFQGLRLMTPTVQVTGQGKISAYDMKNVALKFSENTDNIGIYSMKGRYRVAELTGKTIIGQWESVQLGVVYHIVYAIDDAGGYLYEYKPDTQTFQMIHGGLSVSRHANGLTLAQGFHDVFVFTNGIDDYISVKMGDVPQIQTLHAVDSEGRVIRGLCLKVHNGRLVTHTKNRVHWSKVGDIYEWAEATVGVVTNPAYQEFDRDVTAIETYGNALIVWTDSYSVQCIGNAGDVASFQRTEATGGGCAGFQSVVKFDNKLFYYDPKARNLFAYYLYDTGQMRTGAGLGNQILSYWRDVDMNRLDDVKLVGYVAGDVSEIWCVVPLISGDVILIFDYLKNEWVVRDMGACQALAVIGRSVYCAVGGAVMVENVSQEADGVFYPCSYACQTIHLGSVSNLKIPKMPLVFTFDDAYSNNFALEIMLDENPLTTTIKRIERQSHIYLLWANEDGSVGGEWAEDDGNGGYLWQFDDAFNQTYNLHGMVPFKQMRLRFFTQQVGDAFGIKSIEMKRVKIKTKTIA